MAAPGSPVLWQADPSLPALLGTAAFVGVLKSAGAKAGLMQGPTDLFARDDFRVMEHPRSALDEAHGADAGDEFERAFDLLLMFGGVHVEDGEIEFSSLHDGA